MKWVRLRNVTGELNPSVGKLSAVVCLHSKSDRCKSERRHVRSLFIGVPILEPSISSLSFCCSCGCCASALEIKFQPTKKRLSGCVHPQRRLKVVQDKCKSRCFFCLLFFSEVPNMGLGWRGLMPSLTFVPILLRTAFHHLDQVTFFFFFSFQTASPLIRPIKRRQPRCLQDAGFDWHPTCDDSLDCFLDRLGIKGGFHSVRQGTDFRIAISRSTWLQCQTLSQVLCSLPRGFLPASAYYLAPSIFPSTPTIFLVPVEQKHPHGIM